MSYIFDDTLLGERFSLVAEQGRAYNKTGYELFNFLGDRSIYYIEGWKLFKLHPIIGIGISNYVKVLPSDMPIHSEFMVQLAETGIIGSSLFILFHYTMFRRIFAVRKKENGKNIRLTMCGIMVCILFIGLSAWTYSMKAYYVLFGTIIALTSLPSNETDGDNSSGKEMDETTDSQES